MHPRHHGNVTAFTDNDIIHHRLTFQQTSPGKQKQSMAHTTTTERADTLPHFRPIRQRISRQSPWVWWFIIGSCIFAMVYFSTSSLSMPPPSLPSPSPSRPKNKTKAKAKTKTKFVHPHKTYLDTTQLINYTLLDSLMPNYHGKEESVFPWMERTQPWVMQRESKALSFTQQLQRGLVSRGHSSHELDTLMDAAPRVPNGRASVTALLFFDKPTHSVAQQLSLLSQQSVQCESIWLICTPDTKDMIQQQAALYPVEIMVWDPIDWLQVALRVSTEFLWVVEPDVMPGQRVLERLWRLSQTDAYMNALLGTQGVQLTLKKDGVLSMITDAIENGSLPSVTQPVHMLSDVWLLRRAWLSAITVLPTERIQPHLFGYFVSRDLRLQAEIPTITLPYESLGQEYHVKRSDNTSVQKKLHTAIAQQITLATERGTLWYEPVTIPQEEKPVIAFVVDQSNDLSMLYCQWSDSTVALHVITMGTNRGYSANKIRMSLNSSQPACADRVTVHSLEDQALGMASDVPGMFATKALSRLSRLLDHLKPRVLLYVQKDDPVSKAVQTATDRTGTIAIGIPRRDIPLVSWMSDLPVETLAQWHDFRIKLVIVADQKSDALARLIRSAARARYLGDTVDLTVAMDQSSDSVTRNFLHQLSWRHGNKELRHRITKANTMPAYVEAWYPADNHEYGIVLPEEVELSELYYVWAKYTVLRYRYAPKRVPGVEHLFGVSLYTPRLMENDPGGRRLFNPDLILGRHQFPPRTPFMMQEPCGAGTLYFPEHWREFHDYIAARVADQRKRQLQTVTVPQVRSSEWTHAWRRYLDELLYMRAYVILYPNFEDHTSFATHHFEFGGHLMSEHPQAASLFSVPLMTSQTFLRTLPEHRLPAWADLPVLDLWGYLESLETMVERGHALQRQVSACPPLKIKEHGHDPSDMLCPFGRLVRVPVKSAEEVVEPLATRVISVYVAENSPIPSQHNASSQNN